MNQEDMYAKMYALMVCAASDAIDDLEAGQPASARKRLADALNAAEDFYLEHREGNFGPLSPDEKASLRELREEFAAEYRKKMNLT